MHAPGMSKLVIGTPKLMAWPPNPPIRVFGILSLIGSQWLNMDFHP